VSGIPLPSLLLGAGLLCGLLLAAVTRPFVRASARRRARRAESRLRERVGEVARVEVLDPVEAELTAQRQYCSALARAASP
jgi:hypothetical protein